MEGDENWEKESIGTADKNSIQYQNSQVNRNINILSTSVNNTNKNPVTDKTHTQRETEKNNGLG